MSTLVGLIRGIASSGLRLRPHVGGKHAATVDAGLLVRQWCTVTGILIIRIRVAIASIEQGGGSDAILVVTRLQNQSPWCQRD